jgi:hypothetical protein
MRVPETRGITELGTHDIYQVTNQQVRTTAAFGRGALRQQRGVRASQILDRLPSAISEYTRI